MKQEMKTINFLTSQMNILNYVFHLGLFDRVSNTSEPNNYLSSVSLKIETLQVDQSILVELTFCRSLLISKLSFGLRCGDKY